MKEVHVVRHDVDHGRRPNSGGKILEESIQWCPPYIDCDTEAIGRPSGTGSRRVVTGLDQARTDRIYDGNCSY